MKQSSARVFSKTTLSRAMDKEAKILTEWKFIAHRKRPQKVKEAEHPKQESYEQDSRVNICQIITELVKYLRRKLLLVTLGDYNNINLVSTCVMYQTQKAFHSEKWVLKIEVGETQ